MRCTTNLRKSTWALSALVASSVALILGACALLSACAPKPPAESAESASEEQAPSGDEVPAEEGEKAEGSEGDADTAEEPGEQDVPEEVLSKPTKPALEIVTRPTAAFVVNLESSELKSEKHCREMPSDNPKKIADCKKGARSKFHADILRFKKEGPDYVWEIHKRQFNNLTKLYSIPVKIEKDTDRTVKVTKIGKSTGSQQILVSVTNFTITVPDDYSIQIDDPELGKLVYESRLGLFNE